MQFFRLKRLVIAMHDLAWVPLAIWLAYWFRFNLELIPFNQMSGLLMLVTFALPLHAITFWFFGCYRGIWRFASLPDLWRLLRAVFIGALLVSLAMFLYTRFVGIPRSTVVLYPILLFLGVSTSRVAYRIYRMQRVALAKDDRERALIVGAGRAGDFLIRDLLENGPFLPVGLIDDSRSKQGTEMHGVPVIGTVLDLTEMIDSLEVKAVLIAMPSAPRAVMDEIVRVCGEKHVPCRTLPSLLELADGRVEVSRLRPVTVEDLLGREPVKLDEKAINAYIANKCVAVTGGGGSIGSELCRQVMAHKPSKLLIIDSSEFNLYAIELELRESYSDLQIIPLLADIRIKEALSRIFAAHKPQVVFHAAAYKHVPMVEDNIVEGIRNNILGTQNVADVAVENDVATFVQVSTDKTVNPTNIMGATKRVAEIYCQTLNAQVDTHFVTTRFGNVLGSAGSVVPLFEKQIAAGGPVTVTHPEISRYFMTIPEAASLILQAGAMGKGGEIYVLDMGQPVKIYDLAENMIRLSGFEPDEDMDIDIVGLRPGEKLHEELFYHKEEMIGTAHPKLLLATCLAMEWELLRTEMRKLKAAVDSFDEAAIVKSLQLLVPEFIRDSKPVSAEVVPLHAVSE